MSEILRFWGLVILVVAVLLLITIYMMKKFEKHPMAIYIPTLVIWLVSIVFLVMAFLSTESMQDLGYLVMAMITGAATFIILVITIVISKYRDAKKKH